MHPTHVDTTEEDQEEEAATSVTNTTSSLHMVRVEAQAEAIDMEATSARILKRTILVLKTIR